MTDTNTECARKWWMISAAAGVVVAFIAGAVLGVPWFGSVLLGIIVGGIMGYVTVRSQCAEADVETARPATPSSATSAGATGSGGAAGGAAKPDRPEPAPTPPDGPSGASAGAGLSPSAGQPGTQGATPQGQAGAPDDTAPAAAPSTEDTSASPAPPAEPAPAGGLLDAPRGGKADDLKLIKGVGPKLEQRLNSLGLYHHDQIAALTEAQIAHIDEELDLRGRITRDDWVGQAAALAAGGN